MPVVWEQICIFKTNIMAEVTELYRVVVRGK